MIDLFILWGEAPATGVDPLAGGPGWVGAGLLGSVLGWLLFIHLPSKDKQISSLIESRDKLIKDVSSDFKQSITDIFDRLSIQDKERRDDFREYMQRVLSSYEKEIHLVSSYLMKEVEELSRSIESFNKNFPNQVGDQKNDQKGDQKGG